MTEEFFEKVLDGVKGNSPLSRNREFELFTAAESRKVHYVCRLVRSLEEEILKTLGIGEITVEQPDSWETDGFVVHHHVPSLSYVRRTSLPVEAAYHLMDFLSKNGVPFRKKE